MKELIRKVLKESVYGKDLMEKGAIITAMYNDIEDLLGNEMDLLVTEKQVLLVLTISFGILLI